MLNRILTLALMLSIVICCIFVFTEDPPELERTGPLPILMYHDVTDGPTSDNPMVVTTEKLEGDLCWLKENGYHTILPQELTAGEPLPEKPVLLTFDDGYVSNYRLLFPLLQKYQMKAVICYLRPAQPGAKRRLFCKGSQRHPAQDRGVELAVSDAGLDRPEEEPGYLTARAWYRA